MTSISRRTFFVQSGMAAAAAVLPPSARASDPTDLRARLAHDPLRPQYHLMPGRELRIDNTRAAVTTPKTDALHLRLLVDASVLEIFAQRTTAITERIYTARKGRCASRCRMCRLSARLTSGPSNQFPKTG